MKRAIDDYETEEKQWNEAGIPEPEDDEDDDEDDEDDEIDEDEELDEDEE